jgi:hypothetical protein
MRGRGSSTWTGLAKETADAAAEAMRGGWGRRRRGRWGGGTVNRSSRSARVGMGVSKSLVFFI